MIFFIILPMFQNLKFWRKKKQKNNNKKIEKDSVFTIDNVILKNFPQKKMILSKKSIFRLIMTSNIFHLKIIFYIEKIISKKIWSSKKSFPSNVEPLLTLPPPIVLLRNRQKVPKLYLWVLWRKLEKHDYQSQNVKMEKLRKKTYLWGFRQKFSKISRMFKG